MNIPMYDEKRVHYGLQFGFHQSRYQISHSDQFVASDTLLAITASKSPGINFGLILDYSLTPKGNTGNTIGKIDANWNLRFLPSVVIYDRSFQFMYKGGIIDDTQKYNSTFFDFPLLLKYKSQRRANHRMYVTAGALYGFEVGGIKDPSTLDILATKRRYTELCYGFGVDIYLQYFKFSPEIRFSHGLGNFLVNNNSSYSSLMNHIGTHRVTLFLNFE